MKKEELFRLLQDADPVGVQQAQTYRPKRRPVWRRWAAAAACTVIVAGAALGVPALLKGGGQQNAVYPDGVQTFLAAYPEPVAQNLSAQEFMESDAHWNWWSEYRDRLAGAQTLRRGMESYSPALMRQLLTAQDENTVCSPLNTYIAFAMLAEVSEGDTRQQVLDMLCVDSIDTLRQDIAALWQSNYVDTPVLKSVLANSLWLNDAVTYRDEALSLLARQYYASSFRGAMGTAEMDEALRKWTDDNTGGLLTDYTKDMSTSPETVLELLSTIYYKAAWTQEFFADDTAAQTFHGTRGDTEADMMKRTDFTSVYCGDAFTAVGLPLQDSGSMYFLLPEEGTDVNALLADESLMQVLRGDDGSGVDEHWAFGMVHLSVPKFRVSGKTDLRAALQALGVTDAFDPQRADFTPLTTQVEEIYLSKAEHAAMVEIDEQGVTGAAYTELAMDAGAALPDDELDFVLDRPFLFAVTGSDGSLLFSGIVRNLD